MKILPKIYAQAKGEPFRVDDYRGSKVEFFPLEDTVYYSRFVANGRFHLWTSNGLDYRLFIDKSYYEALTELYSEEMNTISLDYMLKVYGFRNQKRKKTFLWTLAILVVVMGIMILVSMLWPQTLDYLAVGGIVLMLAPYFFLIKKERADIDKFIHEEHAVASELIKKEIGADNFEALLTKQEQYAEQFFADQQEETETPNDETVETLEAPQEDKEDEENHE